VFNRKRNADCSSPESRPKPSQIPNTLTQNVSAEPAINQATSVIGNDLTVTGEGVTIICKSTLVIAGDVSGDINGNWVTVAETGRVQGTIAARAISVYGQVHGPLRATTVTLHATARVESDILQMNLIIAEGAHFNGRVQKAQSEAEVQPVGIEASNPAPAQQPN
jgi:cytoskeletal protein CcmA (bactofilin family)